MRRSLPVLLVLSACGSPPLPDYFDPELAGPSITGVSPASVDTTTGGQQVVIAGSGLSEVQTVVFGTRNATVVEATGSSLTVIVPPFVGGGGPVEVALATDQGVARLDGAFTYNAPASEFTRGEDVSVSITVEECPIEVTALGPGGADSRVWWCGLEAARVSARAWKGAGLQSGYAGELSPTGALSALPEVGRSRLVAPGDEVSLPPGEFFDFLPEGARIRVQTDRDWDSAFDWIAERRALRAATLASEASVTASSTYVVGGVADEAVCFTQLDVIDGNAETLFFDQALDAWDDVELAYSISGAVEREGRFAAASVLSVSDDSLRTGPAGVELPYDAFTGQYTPTAPLRAGDFPFGAEYRLSTRELEAQDRVWGRVMGVERLQLTEPDLLSGEVSLDLSDAIEVRWTPAVGDGDPSYVLVRLVVHEGEHVRSTVVGQGDDALGLLRIPAIDLVDVPEVAVQSDDGESLSRWAELTVARHQLRRAEVTDDPKTDVAETMVVDFVSAVSGVVALER